jgi:hypothetical protein
MSHFRQYGDSRNQQGVALIIMLTLLVIGAATLLVSSPGHHAWQFERNQRTADALAKAKLALIGYAITYGDTHSGEVPGYLPCPDNAAGNPEGSVELNCGDKNVSRIGRLPWKTLGLTLLRDGDGECLWYAVSGTYKNNPKSDLMNWDNNGQFEILDESGEANLQNAVAVIFSPGAVLNNQNRAADGSAPICGGNYNAINYLENDASFNNAIVSGMPNAVSRFRPGASALMNDRMIVITRDDIWKAMAQRNDFSATLKNMTLRVAECIADYGRKNKIDGNKSLPWPAPLTLTDYGDNSYYNDSKKLSAGRVPYRIDASRKNSDNSMGNDYLLTKGSCEAKGGRCVNNCPNPDDWARIYYPWWDNWKDHFFYVVGHEFLPDNQPTNNCGNCLKINHTGNYAAVVVFAGQKIDAINRTRKNNVADYLEGRNAGNLVTASDSGDYQSAPGTNAFNDILYCINEDLSVVPCS